MSTLKDFPPCVVTVAQPDWECGPVGQSRDSDDIEEHNFNMTIEQLLEVDPRAADFESIVWRHWACGWVEEVFTRPGSKAHELALEIRRFLSEVYPVLSEDRLDEGGS